MSDRINQLIESIREKSMLLKEELVSEKQNNEKLQQEIQDLKAQSELKDQKVTELNVKIAELNESITKTKQSSIDDSKDSGISDEHIDELVKEIEYCITQLKK